jgi:hypothetical protein
VDLVASWVWKHFEEYVRNHRFKALAQLRLPGPNINDISFVTKGPTGAGDRTRTLSL